MSDPEAKKITAEEAAFTLELAANGMAEGHGLVGYMDGTEARKLASFLWTEEGPMPEEMRQFFGFDKEGS